MLARSQKSSKITTPNYTDNSDPDISIHSQDSNDETDTEPTVIDKTNKLSISHLFNFIKQENKVYIYRCVHCLNVKLIF